MESISCDELARLSVFKKFYNVAHEIFGVAIALLRPDSREGISLGPEIKLNPFCRGIRKDPKVDGLCKDCDYRFQRKVKSSGRSLRYHCHMGLTDFIIPVIVNGEYIAYLQCGQILDKKPAAASWKRTSALLKDYKIDFKKVKDYYFKTRVIPPATQESLISLLEIFANYLADAGTRLLLLERDRRSQIVFLAESYIKKHLGDPISLDDVAAAVFTSKRNLTRVFSRETGMTVLEFVTRLKIDRVCELMEDPQIKISQAAFECGFGSIQQFNRVFRRVKGITPRQFRENSRSIYNLIR
jgi:AraC-like DNA-binding protein/ligand-binding sensor protein